MGTMGDCLGIKLPGRGACNSAPFITKVKNDGAIPPLPHNSLWCGAYLINQGDSCIFARKLDDKEWLFTSYRKN
jgi:hypothetical protein